MSKTIIYCDDCGDPIRNNADRRDVAELPLPVESANAGESAILCSTCYGQLQRNVLEQAGKVGREMKTYTVQVHETLTRMVTYLVEADTLSEATDKAAMGETILETPCYEDEIIKREIGLPQEVKS